MEFLSWWFDTHYIVSTLMTPGLTVAWAAWRDLDARFWVAFVVWLVTTER